MIWRRRIKRKETALICKICGKEFTPSSKANNAKFCSDECKKEGKIRATRRRRAEAKAKKDSAKRRALAKSDRSDRIHRICKEQHISYGQAQAQETLQALKRKERTNEIPKKASSD